MALPIEKGEEENGLEKVPGSEITKHLILIYTVTSGLLSFGFVVQTWAVGYQNITELVSRVNKPISFKLELRKVRLFQFSSPPRQLQAPFSH